MIGMKYLKWNRNSKILIAAILVGFFSTLLGNTLKFATEYYEYKLYSNSESHPFLFFIFPFLGLFSIYFLRRALFKNKPNKGLKEIFEAIKTKNSNLPAYKIPSHYFNGLLTVVFGGSTGIEVSTVVASAAIGSVCSKKIGFLKRYKTELICAGVAAAITALFNSPIAGILFSFEVISKKITRLSIFISVSAVCSAFLFNYTLQEKPLFLTGTLHWNTFAIPYFILLGILAGFNSIYLTKSVIYFKNRFSKLENEKTRVFISAVIIGVILFIFPSLFGEGYRTIKELLNNNASFISIHSIVFLLLTVLLLKPIITSITLSGGGDGGVFAPSLFIGAILGLIVSTVLNQIFGLNVIPLNFILVGMGAVLSSSIHAPFTSIFLICGLIGNYTLLIPLLIACMVSKFVSQKILPYTVYSYSGK